MLGRGTWLRGLHMGSGGPRTVSAGRLPAHRADSRVSAFAASRSGRFTQLPGVIMACPRPRLVEQVRRSPVPIPIAACGIAEAHTHLLPIWAAAPKFFNAGCTCAGIARVLMQVAPPPRGVTPTLTSHAPQNSKSGLLLEEHHRL